MQEQTKKFGQIMAKCWADEAFKKKFKEDPCAVLKEHGVDFPEGMKFHVFENTDKEAYIIIPPKPEKELSDEHLDKVSAGGTWGTIGSACIATAGTAYSHG